MAGGGRNPARFFTDEQRGSSGCSGLRLYQNFVRVALVRGPAGPALASLAAALTTTLAAALTAASTTTLAASPARGAVSVIGPAVFTAATSPATRPGTVSPGPGSILAWHLRSPFDSILPLDSSQQNDSTAAAASTGTAPATLSSPSSASSAT